MKGPHQKILLTGSSGFLGAWVARELLARQIDFVMFDRDPDLRRLDALVPGRPEELQLETGDIADSDRLTALVEQHRVTAVIHLAALQMPFCRPDPLEGARVNVLGTLAVFEAARRTGRIQRIAYASSAAVIGPEEFYGPGAVVNDAPLMPATHYGVFKQANEGAARVYWLDHQISSVGLRPWTVFGLGRDQGLTSDATKAIKAALLGRPFTIRYGGRNALQYARDVAACFVLSALNERPGAHAFNLRGEVVEMTDYVAAIEAAAPQAAGLIRCEGEAIPVACDLDDGPLREFLPALPQTPMQQGIEQTLRDFQRLQSGGTLDASDLDR